MKYVVALALILPLAGGPGARADDTAQYTYDALGRLQTVTYANGTTITYNYDLAGNRLGQTVSCGTSGC